MADEATIAKANAANTVTFDWPSSPKQPLAKRVVNGARREQGQRGR